MPSDLSASFGSPPRYQSSRRSNREQGWRWSWLMDQHGTGEYDQRTLSLSAQRKQNTLAQTRHKSPLVCFAMTHRVDRGLVLPVHKSPNPISESRSQKPTDSTACSGRQSQDNKWVEAHNCGAEMFKVLARQNLHTDSGADSRAGN